MIHEFKMIHEVRHLEQPLPAGRAAGRDHSIPALRDGWQLIHEGVKGVSLEASRSGLLFFFLILNRIAGFSYWTG
jgi:hypothetical protein